MTREIDLDEVFRGDRAFYNRLRNAVGGSTGIWLSTGTAFLAIVIVVGIHLRDTMPSGSVGQGAVASRVDSRPLARSTKAASSSHIVGPSPTHPDARSGAVHPATVKDGSTFPPLAAVPASPPVPGSVGEYVDRPNARRRAVGRLALLNRHHSQGKEARNEEATIAPYENGKPAVHLTGKALELALARDAEFTRMANRESERAIQ